jgi:hypothetical protein
VDEVDAGFIRGVRESRRRQRTNCNIPAHYWIAGDPTQRNGVVRNLSESGAFLETEPFPVGTALQLIMVRDKEVEMRDGEVVWLEDIGPSARVRTIRGVGVRFRPPVQAESG